MKIGVLALQGSSEPHLQSLRNAGETPVAVRQLPHLDGLTHLVIPGGESTTLWHLMNLFGLWDEIRERHQAGRLALFGTCAGAILMGRDDGQYPPRWGVMDADVARNDYGRQSDSFTANLPLTGLDGGSFRCVFIRAPRFVRVGDELEVLAWNEQDPVLVRGPGFLAATFHPELTDDPSIHRLFMEVDPSLAHRLDSLPVTGR